MLGNVLNSKHIELLKKIGVCIDLSKEYSNDEILAIEDCVSDYLQRHGLGEQQEPNAEGLICLDILDAIALAF